MNRPSMEILPAVPESRAFQRLHVLVRKGYKPHLGSDAGDGPIRLTHAGRTPDLFLHPDGSIVEITEQMPRHKRKLPVLEPIPARADADEVRFMQFVDSVPRASLRDRTRRWRTKWVYGPLFVLAVGLISFLFSAIMLNL